MANLDLDQLDDVDRASVLAFLRLLGDVSRGIRDENVLETQRSVIL